MTWFSEHITTIWPRGERDMNNLPLITQRSDADLRGLGTAGLYDPSIPDADAGNTIPTPSEGRHTIGLYMDEIAGDNIMYPGGRENAFTPQYASNPRNDIERALIDSARSYLSEPRTSTHPPNANPGVTLPPNARPFAPSDVIRRLRSAEDASRLGFNLLADDSAFGSEVKWLFARLGFDDVRWSCTCQSAGSSDGSLVLLAAWEHHLSRGHTLTVHREMPQDPGEETTETLDAA